MLIIEQPSDMRRRVGMWRQAGSTMAFVPTMGALHEGHLTLVRAARERADKTVVSLFVNPTQFGPNEDFAKYPRPLEADLAKCRECGVDAVFAPTADTIYPPGDQTIVEVTELSQHLCGPFRPGHFRGVATVVFKLFSFVFPQFAIFGEKDYQQLKLIERMARDLHLPVTIVPIPTVREANGLAMSSRNCYLSNAEREQATTIYRVLRQAQGDAKETLDATAIRDRAEQTLRATGITRIDYVAVVDAATLAPLATLDRPARCCIAAYVGATRLIDNISLNT